MRPRKALHSPVEGVDGLRFGPHPFVNDDRLSVLHTAVQVSLFPGLGSLVVGLGCPEVGNGHEPSEDPTGRGQEGSCRLGGGMSGRFQGYARCRPFWTTLRPHRGIVKSPSATACPREARSTYLSSL